MYNLLSGWVVIIELPELIIGLKIINHNEVIWYEQELFHSFLL